jgi:chromosome segregation ATPase
VIPLCKLKLGIWLLALLLLLASGMCARPARAEGTFAISGSELDQLSSILTRLDELNGRLQSELANSKESLRQLEAELTACKQDLAELTLRLQQSEQVLTQLQEQLQRAKNLLTQLEQSFEAYKSAAESRIRALTRQRNLAILAAIIAVLI